MTDPVQWHPTYEELLKQAEKAVGEKWFVGGYRPDAIAKRVVDVIWPQMQGKILEYEHALEHVTDPHEGPVCEACQMLCQSALDGVNREMCIEMASDTWESE